MRDVRARKLTLLRNQMSEELACRHPFLGGRREAARAMPRSAPRSHDADDLVGRAGWGDRDIERDVMSSIWRDFD